VPAGIFSFSVVASFDVTYSTTFGGRKRDVVTESLSISQTLALNVREELAKFRAEEKPRAIIPNSGVATLVGITPFFIAAAVAMNNGMS